MNPFWVFVILAALVIVTAAAGAVAITRYYAGDRARRFAREWSGGER